MLLSYAGRVLELYFLLAFLLLSCVGHTLTNAFRPIYMKGILGIFAGLTQCSRVVVFASDCCCLAILCIGHEWVIIQRIQLGYILRQAISFMKTAKST